MLHLKREARDWSTYNEYSYRIILLLLLYVYCSRAHPHFPSQFWRRRMQDLVLPLAQTHKKLGRKAIYFFQRNASKFLETYFRKHSNTLIFCKRGSVSPCRPVYGRCYLFYFILFLSTDKFCRFCFLQYGYYGIPKIPPKNKIKIKHFSFSGRKWTCAKT